MNSLPCNWCGAKRLKFLEGHKGEAKGSYYCEECGRISKHEPPKAVTSEDLDVLRWGEDADGPFLDHRGDILAKAEGVRLLSKLLRWYQDLGPKP